MGSSCVFDVHAHGSSCECDLCATLDVHRALRACSCTSLLLHERTTHLHRVFLPHPRVRVYTHTHTFLVRIVVLASIEPPGPVGAAGISSYPASALCLSTSQLYKNFHQQFLYTFEMSVQTHTRTGKYTHTHDYAHARAHAKASENQSYRNRETRLSGRICSKICDLIQAPS